MFVRRILPVAALVAFLPITAQATGTTFKGTVTLRLTIDVTTPLSGSQTMYCQLDLRGSDTGAESFTAHHALSATPKTGGGYQCTVAVPYDWTDKMENSDTLNITGTYTAVVYDTTLPQGATPAESTGTFLAGNAITSGQNVNYLTTVKLY